MARTLLLILMISLTLRPSSNSSADERPATKREKLFSLNGWEVNLDAVLSGVETRLQPAADKQLPAGELRLKNRGYIFSKSKSFMEYRSVEVKLDWSPQTGGGGKAYADNLLVLLRCTGKTSTMRSWETSDGLRVRIDAGSGKVSIDDAATSKVLAAAYVTVDDEGTVTVSQDKPATESVVLKPRFYAVSVKDDGQKVTVSLGGKQVVTATKDSKEFHGGRIGLGNREFIGGFNQESVIRNLEVLLGL